MTDPLADLRELDRIAHDVAQTHLPEFGAGRGPYPGHPADKQQKGRTEADSTGTTPRVNGSSPPVQSNESAASVEVAL